MLRDRLHKGLSVSNRHHLAWLDAAT
jgi:hypothetical protein